MRRTKEEAAKTRQDLLDAALQVFSQKGYQATRLQDIADAAGTTRGAIYHHFNNKADLYKSLMEDASEQGNQTIQAAVAEGGSFADITRRILVNTMQMLVDDRRFRQTWALSLFKTGVSPDLAELEKARIQNAEAQVDGVAAYMQQGIETGELRPDLDPHVAARAFLAYQNGVAWLWLANGEFFAIGDDAETLADVLWRGLSTQ